MFVKVITEGDCEGRTTKTVAIFQCDNERQVASYLLANKIKPYYHFTFTQVRNPLEDIRNYEVPANLVLSTDNYGRANISTGETEQELFMKTLNAEQLRKYKKLIAK